jgi:hypothetical protein
MPGQARHDTTNHGLSCRTRAAGFGISVLFSAMYSSLRCKKHELAMFHDGLLKKWLKIVQNFRKLKHRQMIDGAMLKEGCRPLNFVGGSWNRLKTI